MDIFNKAVEQLAEKGYLADNFKTGTQLGSWLKDFRERLDSCQQQAKLHEEPRNLLMETMGRFQAGLELVFFTFRYRYDPQQDTLTLKSLYARLDKHSKSYKITGDNLRPASEVHETLSRPAAMENYAPLYKQLQRDFDRDRNADDDYQSHEPGYLAKNHPLKLSENPDPPAVSV